MKCKPIEMIGKASYNIFLTQKVFYCFPGFLWERFSGRMLQLAAAAVICLLMGILFYRIETPFTDWLDRKTKNVWIHADKRLDDIALAISSG